MNTHYLRAALYARVSSEQQVKENTIASQIAALKQRILDDGLPCESELHFVDDGYSGGTLIRPALERLRDQAAAGAIDRLYVHSPDRLSRKYAYQVLLVEEFTRYGVEIIFLNNAIGTNPEETLLLQVQGMIAEYERAKIVERSRRGKLHAARRGSVNALTGAPYGYRYVTKHEGDGEARYQVLAEEAQVVRKMFQWVGQERCSIREVCRRLQQEGVPTRKRKARWDRTTVWTILKNPAYKGTAAFGKRRNVPLNRKRLRPMRGRPENPNRPISYVHTAAEEQIFIEVPPLISEELFAVVQEQLQENRLRQRVQSRGCRYLLQGLLVCKRCGYGYHGKVHSRKSTGVRYEYYRCTGSDAHHCGGQRQCWNRPVRIDLLNAAVWEDVRCLLSEPCRIKHEYERRCNKTKPDGARAGNQLAKLINQVKKSISRLIDAYEQGLLDQSEFEPRIIAARERLSRLEEERKREADQEVQESELRVVIGQLEEFARRVSEELREPDWLTRRQIIRALVKQVEIDEDEVRLVYRVSPSPFEGGPQRASWQHCWGRQVALLGCNSSVCTPVEMAWATAKSPCATRRL